MAAIRRRGTLAALALIVCLPAAAKETVTWFINSSFPPAHIAAGRFAGEGINDRELTWLIAHLPQFDHLIVNSTSARSWYEMGRGDARCVASALKTPEREKQAVFSVPAAMSWGIMLLVRDDRLPDLRKLHGPSGDIDLFRLMADSALHGVVSSGRGYGAVIDHLIASPEGQHAVQRVADSLQTLRMVAAGRADYAIGYPFELGYFRKMDGSSEPITILPIEGISRYFSAFVACSNQVIGRSVIEAVNAALAQEGPPPPYMKAAKQWLNDKEFSEIMTPSLWTAP
jgi:uncharacterized protein (TIGR02285 family)